MEHLACAGSMLEGRAVVCVVESGRGGVSTELTSGKGPQCSGSRGTATELSQCQLHSLPGVVYSDLAGLVPAWSLRLINTAHMESRNANLFFEFVPGIHPRWKETLLTFPWDVLLG